MSDKPDVVWIYCDELRTDALGCYGHPEMELHTPNLDRLAGSGIRFENNFCNSPICVSSRVCALTGMHPEQTGVYCNEGAWKNFELPRPLDTFPQVFSRHGYRTANFGKIHVARPMYPGASPGPDIFQHHNGEGGGMGFWKDLGEEAVQMIRSPGGGMNGGIYPGDEPYLPEKVTTNAIDWMEKVESPSFTRLSILQPHTPVLPPEEFVELYKGQDPGMPDPLPETVSEFEKRVADVHGLDRMDPKDLRAARLHYYALVAWIDSQIGRVLEFLEREGRLTETIVIFGSDHGNPLGDTGAFEKHTFTPTVHRVPLLISWPDTLPDGQVRDDISESLDYGPTLMSLCGIDIPEQYEGRDLFSDPAPQAICSTIGFGQPDSKMGPNGGSGEWFGGRGWPRRSCVRTARWRLGKNMLLDGEKPSPEDEDIFLADVQEDPKEMVNLATEPRYAEVVNDLSRKLDKHAEGSLEVPHRCLVR
ncbi:MAG: sulfatase [Candidatus Brocadiia bacterium]